MKTIRINFIAFRILCQEPLHPSVAEVKNCSTNLLASEIDCCSHLWMENRTFYLGTPHRKTSKAKRERSLSCPSAKLDEHQVFLVVNLKSLSLTGKIISCQSLFRY